MDQVLKTRTISGLIFGVIVLGLLALGEIGLFTLLCIVLLGSTYEYLKITKLEKPKSIISYIIVLGLLVISFLLHISSEIKLLILFFSFIIYLLLSITIFNKKKLPHHSLLPSFIILYPTCSLVLPIIFKGNNLHESHFWLIIILLIWSSDSFAYLVGRKIGKTKLFERLSPKKTWEGFLGAGLLTVLFGVVLGNYFSTLSILFWISCSIIIWVIGTVGDLFESSIKRTYDVKDSGNILPGHGGFLDRFDSFIFVIPFIYFLLYTFKYLQ